MRVQMKFWVLAVSLIIAVISVGCEGKDVGLAEADHSGNGPTVHFDFDAKPLPEIPFPNNLGMIADPDSPTGRRINVSVFAPTVLEEELRMKINELDGFGILQPITVQFDKPLHLQTIVDHHHDANLDPTNDIIFLLNIDPNSPKYGTAVPLDVGQGNFPVVMASIPGDPYTLERRLCEDELVSYADETGQAYEGPMSVMTTGYFNHCDTEWNNTIADPHIGCSNLLYETHEEDVNGNGILDEGEDIDSDGVLDHPNVLMEGGDQYDDLVTFFEKESNTLIFRPLLPLEEKTTYAVVLTKGLRGVNSVTGEAGDPIQSAFDGINHLKQTDELVPMLDVLGSGFTMEGDSEQRPLSLSIDDIAFTWSYTTQSITEDLVTIRKGLYGVGPFNWLEEQYPAEMKQVDRMTLLTEDLSATPFDERNQYVMPIDNLREILQIAGTMLLAELVGEEHAAESVEYMVESMNSISHMISGRFTTPYFLADQDEIGTEGYAADYDESFKINSRTGEAHVGEDEVTWWCAIPKETERFKQPFPVSVYSHGYSANRFEVVGFASLMARYGLATCGIDSVGHGLVIPANFLEDDLVQHLLDQKKVSPAIKSIATGRARDLNNDGVPDSGGDFWTADTFHTRDIVRQSTIDTMQFIRIMRHFDGEAKWNDGVFENDGEYFTSDSKPTIAGDFDDNGVPDIGGMNQDYYAWGQSLGGFITTLLAATDPAVTAAAPVAAGAGLIDVGIRTIQEGVIQAVFLQFMGPFLYAQRVPGTKQLSFGFIVADNTRWWASNDGVHDYYIRDFARTDPDSKDRARVGDRVVIVNEKSGDEWFCILDENMSCRTGYAADAMDATEKRHLYGMKDEWYFRGTKEIMPQRDGGDYFWQPTDEQLAEMGEEEKRLFDLRSEIHWIDDATKVGDPIRIEIRSPGGRVKEVIEQWAQNIETVSGEPFPGGFYQGFFYRPGDKLVSPGEGLGRQRQTPDFRRMMMISAMILEPADPAAYARHLFERPLDFSDVPADAALYEFRKQREGSGWTPHVDTLVIPTNGDMNVPVATEYHLGRSAGMIELYKTRPEWDGFNCENRSYSENDMLIESKSLEVIESQYYFDNSCWSDARALNFDADNLDGNLDEFDAPTVPGKPLRATVVSRPWDASESRLDRQPEWEGSEDGLAGVWRAEEGISAMRVPYLLMEGSHGFVVPAPYKIYDIDQHMINMVGRFFQSHGKELWDHPCLADSSCEFFDEDDYAVPPE